MLRPKYITELINSEDVWVYSALATILLSSAFYHIQLFYLFDDSRQADDSYTGYALAVRGIPQGCPGDSCTPMISWRGFTHIGYVLMGATLNLFINDAFLSLRLLSIAMSLLSVFMVFILVREISSNNTALLATFFYSLSYGPMIYGVLALTESSFIFFSLLIIYLITIERYFPAYLLSFFSFFIRPDGVLLVLITFLHHSMKKLNASPSIVLYLKIGILLFLAIPSFFSIFILPSQFSVAVTHATDPFYSLSNISNFLLTYLKSYFTVLFLLGFAVFIKDRKLQPLLSFIILSTAFTTSILFFPEFMDLRLYLPLIPYTLTLSALGIHMIFNFISSKLNSRLIGIIFVTCLVLVILQKNVLVLEEKISWNLKEANGMSVVIEQLEKISANSTLGLCYGDSHSAVWRYYLNKNQVTYLNCSISNSPLPEYVLIGMSPRLQEKYSVVELKQIFNLTLSNYSIYSTIQKESHGNTAWETILYKKYDAMPW